MLISRLWFCAIAALSTLAAASSSLVYIGTYTGAKSKGIYVYRFDEASGKLTPLGVAAETRNPSFVAVHPNGKYLYAANETNQGTVTAYSVDASTGKLTELNSVPSHGAGPCYAMTDKKGRVAMVANYGSGSFASYPISVDGHLGEAASTIQDSGSGPSQRRQEGPHAHSINPSPDNRFAIGADLGLDKLLIWKLDTRTAKLTPNTPDSAILPGGSGPRHFAFHPSAKFAYSINELQSTITAFSWNASKGVLTEVQTISTLPQDFKGENTTAHIAVHPNGRFVYGSNRGHDSIAVFAVDRKTGKLTPVEHVSTKGKTPRNFTLDPGGHFLIAANQASDNLVVFRVDPNTGKLTATGETADVGSPVCVRFVAGR